jgi:phosphoribosylformylglycinamidine (FGAM) synthase-like enzyme
VICGPGENAGVVDIGDGQAVVFKMESHNHPSFIEPYQGAATGVGGIMRDVFTMGARPIALLNALRFGDPAIPKTRRWWPAWSPASAATATASACRRSAARPISTAATTATSWSTRCASASPTPTRSSIRPPPAPAMPVVYVGSKTGRDGIHGATMASAEFGEDSRRESARPCRSATRSPRSC